MSWVQSSHSEAESVFTEYGLLIIAHACKLLFIVLYCAEAEVITMTTSTIAMTTVVMTTAAIDTSGDEA